MHEGLCDAHSVGVISWSTGRAGLLTGSLAVYTDLALFPEARLVMNVRPQAPSEPRLALLGAVALVRVCVNGFHGGWPRCTHVHRYQVSGEESAQQVPDLVDLPLGATVRADAYRRTVEAFAEVAKVTLRTPFWRDPPGRR